MKADKQKLDMILNHYTQNELAIEIGITQWRLLLNIQNDSFDAIDIDNINYIFDNLNEHK